uniref:INSulin related n=1 Tax=Caenorhabditis tropicalis TaxID=1561998 RepID=A0A1I7UHC4_9PELO
MSRPIIIILAVVLAFLLVFDQVNSAPAHHRNKKHTQCESRLYKTMLTLCNHKGNPKIMKETAERCCVDNCDLIEMMSSCQRKSEDEEDLQAESVDEINQFVERESY